MPPKPPGTRHVPRETPVKPFWQHGENPASDQVAPLPLPGRAGSVYSMAELVEERFVLLESRVAALEEALTAAMKGQA